MPLQTRLSPIPRFLLLASLVAAIAVFFTHTNITVTLSCSLPCLSPLCGLHNPATASDQVAAAAPNANMSSDRTPVYFLSHGGYV